MKERRPLERRLFVFACLGWSGGVAQLCTLLSTASAHIAQRVRNVLHNVMVVFAAHHCLSATCHLAADLHWAGEGRAADISRTATVGSKDGNRCRYLFAIDQGFLYPFVQFPVFYTTNVWSQTIPFGSLAKWVVYHPMYLSVERLKKCRQILPYWLTPFCWISGLLYAKRPVTG